MDIEDYLSLSERTEKKIVEGITMDQSQSEMLHAALGLAGEAGEMAQAFLMIEINGKIDITNMGEEVGDYSWFAAQLSRQQDIPFEDIKAAVEQSGASMWSVRDSTLELARVAGEIVDTVKKNIIYNKEMDSDRLRENTIKAWEAVGQMAKSLDLDPYLIMEANISKLAKRFGDKYTDLAAQVRDLDAERDSLGAYMPMQ